MIATERDFLDMIGEVGRDVTDRRVDPVRWLLAHAQTNGVIQLRLIGRPAGQDVPETVLPEIVSSVVNGLAAVEQEAVQPPHFTDRALELTQGIAERTAETGTVRVVNGTSGTTLTLEGTGTHVQRLLGASYSALGSVEGRLEGINVHGGDRYINVYDMLTDKSVRCYIARRVSVPEIAEALERRVIVHGKLNYRPNGQIASVLADDLTVLPRDEELPSFQEVRGILK